ncbi:hypothetical protein [Jonesia quinghaiensis]|uniref:hypothetical protein n=1 Tax=Jonesia quinghaiensis TaxID=262806 RepID=UPI00040979F9|nr:hypothetical protein [Jonesia quinghaiensis]
MTAFRAELTNRYVVVWCILITVLWCVTPQLLSQRSWSGLLVFTELFGAVPASIAAAWASATVMGERTTRTMAIHQVLSVRSHREQFVPIFLAHVLLFAITPMLVAVTATVATQPFSTAAVHPDMWIFYTIALIFMITAVAIGHLASGLTALSAFAGVLSFWAMFPLALYHRMPVLALAPYTTVNPWFYAITSCGIVCVIVGAYFSSRLRYERHSPTLASRARSITVTLIIIAAISFTVAALAQPQTVSITRTAEQAHTSISTFSTKDIPA